MNHNLERMEIIDNIMPDHVLHALGWTFVHSLWQGLLIAFLLGIYFYRKPMADARRRYLAGFMALAGTLGMACVTFFFMLERPDSGLAFFAEGRDIGIIELEAEGTSFFADQLNEYMPLIVLTWLIGVALFLLKMLGGLLYVQRLKHRHLSAVPANWQAVLEKLKTQIGFSASVQLSASALVKVPMVVGWLKPVVLMPISAVNQLTIEQVEAILAHELAHIARYDYALNILQSLVEVIFYFNPAVWWISANIRTERENCCDDLAVELCGNPINYARALVSLQEMHQATPAFALSFANGKNQLLTRIRRILKQPHKNSNAMERFSVIGLTLAAAIMLSMQASSNLTVHSNEPDQEFYSMNEWDMEESENPLDTIPNGTIHWQRNTDDEQVEIKIKDGEVVYLKIDGEEIPEEEYGDYEGEIVDMLENVPPPPPPPPHPPHFNENEFGELEPPSPPVPPSPFSRTITTERDGKNTTIIIESETGDEPIEIEVEGGRRGNVIINGKELEGLKDGEERVVVEEIFPHEKRFLFYPNSEENVFVFPEMEEEIEHIRILKKMEGEHVFVFPEELEFDEEEWEELANVSMEKHEHLLEELAHLELEGAENEVIFLELESLKELEGLNEEEMEALKDEHRILRIEMKEAHKASKEAMKEMRKLREMERKEMRRYIRRSDGAM